MRARYCKLHLRFPLLLGLLILAGCSHYEPFEPTSIDSIPDWPGLFTGEQGELVIYGDGEFFPPKNYSK